MARLPGACALLLLAAAESLAQDRVVLRSGKTLRDCKVVSFDEDGVRLAGKDAPLLGWDEVESAKLAAEQERFDRMLREVGDPLFRVRLRLEHGRHGDALEPAEKLFARYAGRRSPAAYFVCQALMWARLAHGRREEAVEPYVVCVELSHALGDVARLPGARRPHFDADTGLSPDLPPVWFDGAAAKASLPRVRDRLAALGKPASPGGRICAATLALTAGDEATADALLATIAADGPAVRELLQVVAAQREVLAGKPGQAVRELEAQADKLREAHKPLAAYWLGMAALAARDERTNKLGVLRLLHVPALYGESPPGATRTPSAQPELAAAALHHAARALAALGDAGAAARLRTELRRSYPHTVYGARERAAAAGAKP
jgi:hypothetical protein